MKYLLLALFAMMLFGCTSEPSTEQGQNSSESVDQPAPATDSNTEEAAGPSVPAKDSTADESASQPAPAVESGTEVSAVRSGQASASDNAAQNKLRTQASRIKKAGLGRKDKAPDFNLPILANGEGSIRLHAQVGPEARKESEAAIVVFVASWCGRCKASFPTLETLQKQYGDELRVLLLTSETNSRGKEAMARELVERKVDLPLLDAPPELIELWLGPKKNIPRFYLIDYTGTIRVMDTGFGKKMSKLLPKQVAWLMKRREYDTKKH